MVDSIGPFAVKTGDIRVATVARVAPAAAPVASPSSQETVTKTASAPTLARTMAASPPVDTDRVKQIKNALANGTFPLSPSTIADQMIALKYQWMSND